MKFDFFLLQFLFVQGLFAHLFSQREDGVMAQGNSSRRDVLVPRWGNRKGRACDFTQGIYVSWVDTTDAIKAWCSHNAGYVLHKGEKLAQTVRQTEGGDYKAGTARVNLYGMFSHIPGGDLNCG